MHLMLLVFPEDPLKNIEAEAPFRRGVGEEEGNSDDGFRARRLECGCTSITRGKYACWGC